MGRKSYITMENVKKLKYLDMLNINFDAKRIILNLSINTFYKLIKYSKEFEFTNEEINDFMLDNDFKFNVEKILDENPDFRRSSVEATEKKKGRKKVINDENNLRKAAFLLNKGLPVNRIAPELNVSEPTAGKICRLATELGYVKEAENYDVGISEERIQELAGMKKKKKFNQKRNLEDITISGSKELDEAIRNLKNICLKENRPMFLSIFKDNFENKTIYTTDFILPITIDVKLNEDKIADYIKTMMGYKPIETQEDKIDMNMDYFNDDEETID